ncbi:glucose-6-phosphate isomerase family protein [Salipaludibacillus aurantiacus]|uniref:glucose-6-phosphate isomerase n=1 Tax=Salipaludibacillus aurantiacus TaxID=1601833 RepID=A0A1H9UR38_9BACI|nr:glucose-6-phosphate isomerase family protein [Salipaludibacillus aurantiacus]SES11799.1 glucose-6-phosphate isomerase [Salipaludibacillus aurantiacus]
MTRFDPKVSIMPKEENMTFTYGEGIFGPVPEHRKLDDIRKSLQDPDCDGPDTVYSIVMDVGKEKDKRELEERMLLFGVVTYAKGQLGKEPIRSQGHIHKVSSHSGWSPPEVYEIWEGEAVIYMQETAKDNPGRCYAVYASPGDVVIVPPKWAHATISANPDKPLTFGAWCDREYGFEYEDVRAHQGLAWYPVIADDGSLEWKHNDNYEYTELIQQTPRRYEEFKIDQDTPIYEQFEADPGKFQFVSKPFLKEIEWEGFKP